MYFGLSEEQKSLEENIQRFLADNAPLESIKAVADGDEEKAQACLLYTSDAADE